MVHHYAVPVRLVHPAFVVTRVLRTVVHHRATSPNAHVAHSPHVYGPEDYGTRGKINAVSRMCVDALAVHTGYVITNTGIIVVGNVWFRSVRKQEQHLGCGAMISGAANRELAGLTYDERDGPSLNRGPDTPAPWPDFRSRGPVVLARTRYGNGRRTTKLKFSEVIRCRSVRHHCRAPVQGHREPVRSQLG